ncbi:unnamed protein product [Rhizophagus irregularis]|nr:unnamed protein product [Rhizophagus irregularis]
MFSNNNNTHPYNNTHDNQESISYDNTYDYNNIHDNIPNNNTLFYDAYGNFFYDNTHESLPPTYDNNTYYENLSYDVSLPYDTLENLSYDTYLPYDTRENFSHDIILDYNVPRENLNENLSDCNENQSNQDYEASDNEDELVELTDSLELIAGLTFNSWDEFKSWINRFALKEGFSYKIRSSEKIEGVIRRVAYECIKSGSNTSQVTSDPTKRRNASSSKTSCPWKLNVTYPKTSESWAIPWIHKRFTTGAQSTQRIESINRHIHDKVDRATSLYDLLLSIKDHVRNEEHFEYFELERNAIPTIGMPMLNTRFFGSVDNVMKAFLTPIMLGKQRSQMNQSVCYDINRITEWQNLIDVEIDNEEISNGIREQEQDVRQILFKSLIKNIPPEAILEVCQWYLDINIQLDNLSPISVCGTQTEDRVGMEKSITFQHFFSFRVDSHISNLAIKSTKAIYAELFGLSKKAIDCALKANMQHELMNLLKSFIYDTHNKNVEIQETQE